MVPNIAREGHAEQAEARLRSSAEIEVADAPAVATALVKATRSTRGSLAMQDGVTVIFSRGTCRVRTEGDRLMLDAAVQSEDYRDHVEQTMTGHLRAVLDQPDLSVNWARET